MLTVINGKTNPRGTFPGAIMLNHVRQRKLQLYNYMTIAAFWRKGSWGIQFEAIFENCNCMNMLRFWRKGSLGNTTPDPKLVAYKRMK